MLYRVFRLQNIAMETTTECCWKVSKSAKSHRKICDCKKSKRNKAHPCTCGHGTKKTPNKPLDADRAACPGRSTKDSSRGRWLFIRHRQAGRTLPHRIGISRRARRLAPVSRSIYRLHRGAQRTCVSWVTLEPIRAPAPRWQPAQRGLTDALRKRTDPSWSYFMPQPTHATPREASNPKSDFSLCAVFPNDCCTSTPSISLGRMWKKKKEKQKNKRWSANKNNVSIQFLLYIPRGRWALSSL